MEVYVRKLVGICILLYFLRVVMLFPVHKMMRRKMIKKW